MADAPAIEASVSNGSVPRGARRSWKPRLRSSARNDSRMPGGEHHHVEEHRRGDRDTQHRE